MSRIALTLVSLLVLPLLLGANKVLGAAPPMPAGQWVVVTAPAFRAALAPLVAQRKAQGLRVVLVTTTDILTAEEVRRHEASKLRDHVHALLRRYPGPSSVLLVGAVTAGRGAEEVVVPTLRGSAGRMKGQPTDSTYGCPDGGLLPSAAVGRFPARTVAEVQGMVAKTLAYEDPRPGEWKRRITVLAGIPAFNPVIDRLVEGVAMARFGRVSPLWTGQAVYTSPASRFCLPARYLKPRSIRYVEEGSAFTLYLGHSSAEGLYAGEHPFLDRDDWAKLKISRGPGVFVTFGCNGCQLYGIDGEGYGLSAVRNPGGPAAVIGSHGICFAAMAQLGADGVFRRTLAGELPERLGDTWLALLQGVAKGSIDPITYRLLDGVDGDPRIPQATQRQEHLQMFLLLGDPALRLPQVPVDMELSAGPVTAGRAVMVVGRAPARLEGAKVVVTLERLLTTEPPDLEPLPREPGPARDKVMLANHERANAFVLASAEGTVRGGAFRIELKVPARLAKATGKPVSLTLRARAAKATTEGLGVRVVEVRAEEGDKR